MTFPLLNKIAAAGVYLSLALGIAKLIIYGASHLALLAFPYTSMYYVGILSIAFCVALGFMVAAVLLLLGIRISAKFKGVTSELISPPQR